MKYYIKTLLLIFLSQIITSNLQAQKKVVAKPSIEKKEVKEDNLNKVDANKSKQGMWFYEYPSKFGDPAYYEFGSYLNNLKSGIWYKMTKDQLLIAIENYQFGELNGNAQYYENGKLSTIGTYRGIYTPYDYDSFMVTNPETLEDTLVIIPAEKGYTKHGTWRYYDPFSGQLTMEREYQVDYLLKEKRFEQAIKPSKPTDVPQKLPHEGGKHNGWNTGKKRAPKSLIK